jgi:outer membrane protein assembly factor BamD (BamD/ComL family)
MTEQLAELKAIRATLASGDAEGAIRQIDAFEASHPVSPLLEEATVLLIDALVAAGRRPEASAMAGSFLRGFPNSAYAEHVQTKVQGP